MEVKINIEATQIGDTVIDLFKNLPSEKKEELALSVMKEWLQSPDFFEIKNKEQLVIEEFKAGKRNPWSNYDKYDSETSDEKIKCDYKFKEVMESYKTSKQIMVEDVRNEVVSYYKKYIADEIKENELIEKIKNETFDIITKEFPSIITQVMIQVFTSNLTQMQSNISETFYRAINCEFMTRNIMDKITR